MAGIEQNQAIEKQEYSKEECDNKLCQLEEKVYADFPFVKNENGTFSIMKDQQILHIDITADKLAQANSLILQLITYYKQNDSSNYEESFYPGGRYAGFGEESLMLDLNNTLDKAYITSTDFENIFGVDFEENKRDLIHFLHKLLSIQQKPGYEIYDYNDSVNNSENNQVINTVKEVEKDTESKYTGKNIKEILEINSNPNREESFANLLFLLNKKFDIKNLGINTSRSFMELTYNNITYVPGEKESLHWRGDVSFEYKGGSFINIKQGNTILGQFRMNDYNDQIILKQLLGITNNQDYKIINKSSAKHIGSRKSTQEELNK